jgi:lactate 2-monooxygenase
VVFAGEQISLKLLPSALPPFFGRPYAYALAVAGESGVEEVINNLVAETELNVPYDALLENDTL